MYYAVGNYYGTIDSRGFGNTNYVLAFSTRADRQEWLDSTADMSARAILRRDVINLATNANLSTNGTNAPRPFSGEYWALVECTEDNALQVACVDPHDYWQQPQRFYGGRS